MLNQSTYHRHGCQLAASPSWQKGKCKPPTDKKQFKHAKKKLNAGCPPGLHKSDGHQKARAHQKKLIRTMREESTGGSVQALSLRWQEPVRQHRLQIVGKVIWLTKVFKRYTSADHPKVLQQVNCCDRRSNSLSAHLIKFMTCIWTNIYKAHCNSVLVAILCSLVVAQMN